MKEVEKRMFRWDARIETVTLHFDLLRTIIRHGERHAPTAPIDSLIQAYGEQTVSDCVTLLDTLGYVQPINMWTFDGQVSRSIRLTRKGEAILEGAQGDEFWARAGEKAAAKKGDCSFEDLKQLLIETADEVFCSPSSP